MMKVCLRVIISLLLVCTVSFGALDTNWVKWTGVGGNGGWATNSNWLRYDNAQVAPVYWNPVYIGAETASGSVANVTVSSGATISTLKTYLGISTDPAASCTLNISSDSTYYIGYNTDGSAVASGVFFTVGSKGVVNTSGDIIAWGVDLNGAKVTINDGGMIQSKTAYWYVRNGAKVTINEGGVFQASNATAYGAGGSSGNIDIRGGTFQLSGDRVSAVNAYITGNFLTAYGSTDDSKLLVSYDGTNTYVQAYDIDNKNKWTGGGDGISWSNASNWSLGHIPVYNTDESEITYIGMNATGNYTIDITTGGDQRAANGNVFIGQATDPDGSYTLNILPNSEFYNVYVSIGHKAVVNIDNGGSFNPFGTKQIDGIVNINGSYSNRSFVWRIDGLMKIEEGGVLRIANGSRFSESAANLTTPNAYFTGVIDLHGGSMVMQGDCSTVLTWHVTNGNIIAYGGHGFDSVVNVDYNSTSNETVVTAHQDKAQAYNPAPADRSAEIPVDASLSWKVGSGASSEKLNIAKWPKSDFNNDGIANADDLMMLAEAWLRDESVDISNDFESNFSDFAMLAGEWLDELEFEEVGTFVHEPGFDANQPFSCKPSSSFENGAKYLWRIDTITPQGVTTGDVWKFQTASIRDINWLYEKYPSLVKKIFNQLNLGLPELSNVNQQVSAGNWKKACRELLDYYKTCNSGSWLRKPAVVPTTEVNEITDLIVDDDIITLVSTTANIPRTARGGLDWTYRGPNGDWEWAWYLNRLEYLINVLQAYRETGNIKYIDRINKDIQDWVLNCPYPGQLSNPQWRGLEVAFRARYFMKLFYELMDVEQFSDVTKLLILSTLDDHAHFLRNYHQTGGNWTLQEMRGLATIGAGWPELKNKDAYLDYAFTTMEPQIGIQVLPDGAYSELSGTYHQLGLDSFEGFAEIAEKTGYPLPSGYSDMLESMWNYFAMIMKPDGFCPMNNDSDNIYLCDFIIGSDQIRYIYVRDFTIGTAETYNRPDWLYVATNGQQGTVPPGQPSVFFPWAGQLISRSGWDANAHYSFFDIGPFGTSHLHNDKLHFSASAYGRDILIDSGRFSYYGDLATTYRAYALSAAAHNVVRIAGENQIVDAYKNTSPQTNDCQITSAYDFAKGSFNGGYTNTTGTAKNTRLMRYERGKYWIIVDRFVTDRPRSIEALWHYHPDCTVVTNGLEVTSNDAGLGNIRIIPLGSVNWNLNIISGQLTPSVQGWYSPIVGTILQNSTAVYSANISGDTVFAWLLVPGVGTPAEMSAEITDSTSTSITIKITEMPGVENIVTMSY